MWPCCRHTASTCGHTMTPAAHHLDWRQAAGHSQLGDQTRSNRSRRGRQPVGTNLPRGNHEGTGATYDDWPRSAISEDCTSCLDRGVFAGPGFGCDPRSSRLTGGGNHGDVMTARQASRIGHWPARAESRPSCPAPAGRRLPGHGPVRLRQPAGIAGIWFPPEPERHEQARSAPPRHAGMDDWRGRRQSISRLVACYVPWFHGVGLSLGGVSMRVGIYPMSQTCLPSDEIFLRIASGNCLRGQGKAQCGRK